ncbi:MAG: hypothetical protein J1E07_01620 [Treponema sp.]|nr:hypothetical protein [Treponema sp.]
MKRIFLALSAVALTLISCAKNQPQPQIQVNAETAIETLEVKSKNHTWYYFTDRTFKEIDKIQHVPFRQQKPWTEAIRISSANNTDDSNLEISKAYAVVNRLGILCFEGDKVSISLDKTVFDDRTAGNLIFLNDVPIFSIYKSAFFNETITEDMYRTGKTDHLFLMQFDDTAKISYPIVNCASLIDEPNSEVVDFVWDGLNWLCSIKSITDERIIFSYISWKPTVPLLTLSPANVRNNIVITESDVDTFRAAKTQIPYNQAPERIRNMLRGFSDNLPFIMEVKSAGGSSNRIYNNEAHGSKEKPLKSKAVLAQSWSGILFEDGTFFIEGALPGKHILRGGKPIAIRLPKLPAGFVYSDFVITGTTLYAAWEETAFYNTGSSGFLKVDLDNTLYSKIR